MLGEKDWKRKCWGERDLNGKSRERKIEKRKCKGVGERERESGGFIVKRKRDWKKNSVEDREILRSVGERD